MWTQSGSTIPSAQRIQKLDYPKIRAALAEVWRLSESVEPDVTWMPSAVEGETSTLTPRKSYFDTCLLVSWSLHLQHSRQLWETWTSEYQAFQAATADALISFGYADRFSLREIQLSLACPPPPIVDKEAEIELEVAKSFKQVPEVQSIYTDFYLGGKKFLILTSNEAYDDALMDKLLLIEREILLSHPRDLPSFAYIPRLFALDEEAVPRDSKLIYKRNYDVIIGSPLVAGGTKREAGQATPV